jgi:chemotaxis protein histidine kinase CheA
MSDIPDELESLLAGMRVEFLETASERVRIIVEESAGLAIAADRRAALARLVREAHTLKGGCGIFGFPSLGDAGAEVERIGKALLAGDAPGPDQALHAAAGVLAAELAAARQR